MDVNHHNISSAFDHRDGFTSMKTRGAGNFPTSHPSILSSNTKAKRDGLDDYDPELLQLHNFTPFKYQQQSSSTMSPSQANVFNQSSLSFVGSNTGNMSSQPSSTQAARSQAGSAFGGSMLPNFNSQQARLTPPLNSGTSSGSGGSGNSFMQSLLFQQPPPSSSPNRMFRQPMPTTSVPVSNSTSSGSTSNLNSVMNPTAAMVASLQQQQQQQHQQQRLAFGQALFGSNNTSSANTQSQSSSQPSMIRRPGTGGSGSHLMDPSEFPVLASSTSGSTAPVSSQSGNSSSRIIPPVSGSSSSGNSMGSPFPGFTQAAAVLANRFANAGVTNAAAFAGLLAGFHQQQQHQQYTNQLAMAAAAAAMASQSQNSSESGGLPQPPQPAFRMDEDDFPALKPATTAASTQNASASAGLIGSGNTSRSGTSVDNLTSGNNNSNTTNSLSASTLSAFTTVESLNRANSLASGRSSTQPQQTGSNGGSIQHSQSSSGILPGVSCAPSTGSSGILVDSDGSVSNIPAGLVADAFGLVGLLSFMKTAPAATLDPASSAIAVGLALTELGLRLNAPEPLHTSFASPWHDAAGSRPHDMDCPVPPEYLVSQQQQQMAAVRDPASGSTLGGFGNRALQQQQQFQLMPSAALRTSHEDLLFYLFYTCPGDALQLAAAAELCRRNWRYHRRMEMWLTRVDGMSQQGQEFELFEVFDYRTWKRERREQRVEYKDVDPTELFQFIQQQQMASQQSSAGASSQSQSTLASAPSSAPVGSGGTSGGSIMSRNAF